MDSTNKNIYEQYSKHYLAVDCVIFGYEDNELKLLLYPRGFEPASGKWSLMGGFVDAVETLDQAALRILKQTVGLNNIFMEQVSCFSELDRDPGGRVLSMVYYALIPIDKQDDSLIKSHGAIWWPITKLPDLIFDHKNMIIAALNRLQHKASTELVGKDLLPELFTLSMLLSLYNAIFQRKFDSGNFRKKIASLKVLEQTALKETDSSKRGAYYFKFRKSSKKASFDRIVKLSS